MRQGDAVPAFLKKTSVAGCRRFIRQGVIKPDSGAIADQLEKRGWGMAKNKPAHRIGQRGDVLAARGAQLFAEFRLSRVLIHGLLRYARNDEMKTPRATASSIKTDAAL